LSTLEKVQYYIQDNIPKMENIAGIESGNEGDGGYFVRFTTSERHQPKVVIKYFPYNCGVGIICNLTDWSFLPIDILIFMLRVAEGVSLIMNHTIAMYTTNTLDGNLVQALIKTGYQSIHQFKNKNSRLNNYVFMRQIYNA